MDINVMDIYGTSVVIYRSSSQLDCSGGFKRGRGLWGGSSSPPSNKSSTYINIGLSRLVNVTIWLLIEWFLSV